MVDAAKAQIATVGGVVEAFEARRGSFPESLQALTEGRNAKLKEANLTDPWKQNLFYNAQSDGFSLCSKGPDKKHGGKDDICYGAAPSGKPATHKASGAAKPKSNLERAKAFIDKCTSHLEKITAEVDTAGADHTKLMEIVQNFAKWVGGMKAEKEAIIGSLDDSEKKQMQSYDDEKMEPAFRKLLSEVKKMDVAPDPVKKASKERKALRPDGDMGL